jgi:SAM-dependent methyltransferase
MQPAPADWYLRRVEFYGWRWELGEFLKDIKKILPKGRILEIGCGEGTVLQSLEGLYDAFGIDINNIAVEKTKSKGLKVYPMTVEEFSHQFPSIKFDAIAFFHVLEHIEDPLAFLGNVSEVLNSDGLVFLSVPNPNRISLVFLREHWDYPPHHLVRFSVDGLTRLFVRAGFRIMKIKQQPKDLPLVYITSTVELNKFIKKKLHVDIMRFSRFTRNLLRLLFFIPFNILNFFTILKIITKHIDKGGSALYVVAQKEG